MPLVIGALGTITKGLLKGQEDLEVGGRIETIQTTALLRTARILRRVLENITPENRKKKQTVEHVSDGDTNYNWCTWYSHQPIDTRTGGFGNKRTSRDHPDYSIIKISQNTEESPGDLRRLAVTKTPVRNLRQTLVWKS